jgi:N-acyl-D-amino-acid deacylase
MQQMLTEGLEAGALGLSSGLFTAPGCFSERDELRALGRFVGMAMNPRSAQPSVTWI